MIVLDTNVVVSGFLAPAGPPAQVLRLVTGARETVAFDQRLLAEYRSVLTRPRFHLALDEIDAVLEAIEQNGLPVVAPSLGVTLPDRTDLPFLEVAVSAGARAVVTGNLRHFPRAIVSRLGIAIMSPADWLKRSPPENR